MSTATLDVDHLGGIPFVVPRWPAPPGVRAAMTTRRSGVSRGPYRSLNLGERCGDAPEAVAENRRRVAQALELPAAPAWLRQVHGRRVVVAASAQAPVEADGSVAFAPGAVCAVMAADCLPVLLCDRSALGVAALHAGWRGLAAGVLEAGVKAMGQSPGDLMAWLGPAISGAAFEVGDEVREAFVLHDAGAAACFSPAARPGHWHGDLYALARRRLTAAGVNEIHGGELCTYGIPDWFFSYRRDRRCGRMAALIWLQSS